MVNRAEAFVLTCWDPKGGRRESVKKNMVGKIWEGSDWNDMLTKNQETSHQNCNNFGISD